MRYYIGLNKKPFNFSVPFFLFIAIFLVIYLFFPSKNIFSEDSIAYANSVKYGKELFKPHHLLYNAFNYYLFTPLKHIIPSLDAYRFMQVTNAIFALLCLFVLHRIILELLRDIKKANAWMFFVASCFGVMRYAVDIETYIIPIFFSLLSSFFYLRFLRTRKYHFILFCSLAASVACLFHQIHLFWGIGLFIGVLTTKKWKPVLLYVFPTISVLIIYSIVMVFYEDIDFSLSNLWVYLSDYYYSDSAEVKIGLLNFILTPISLFRTFFQVHGIIIDIIYLIPLFWIAVVIVLILVARGGVLFKRCAIYTQIINTSI